MGQIVTHFIRYFVGRPAPPTPKLVTSKRKFLMQSLKIQVSDTQIHALTLYLRKITEVKIRLTSGLLLMVKKLHKSSSTLNSNVR